MSKEKCETCARETTCNIPSGTIGCVWVSKDCINIEHDVFVKMQPKKRMEVKIVPESKPITDDMTDEEKIVAIKARIKNTEEEISLLKWDLIDYKEWIEEIKNDE